MHDRRVTATIARRVAAPRLSEVLMTLMILTATVIVSILTMVSPTLAASPIEDFLNCMNKRVGKQLPSAVECLPDGCKLTLAMFGTVNQPPCILAGCQLPTVFITCGDKPKRFFLSVTLCPNAKNRDTVEMGLELPKHKKALPAGKESEFGDVAPLEQAKLLVPLTGHVAQQLKDILHNSGTGMERGCTTCHDPITDKEGKTITDVDNGVTFSLASPIKIGGMFLGRIDLSKFTICDDGKPAKGALDELGDTQLRGQCLRDICECLRTDVVDHCRKREKSDPDLIKYAEVARDLCNKLRDYEGNGGKHRPPQRRRRP
jgi:hypothetical protein